MIKKPHLCLALLSVTTLAQGQATEQPPARIEPAAGDKSYFICTVDDVNYDYNARNMGYGHVNLWTKFMKGGKFEAVSPDRVRVRSSSPDNAGKELHEFYKRYATAAFIRGPLFDKGNRPLASVVRGCQVEPGREEIVSAKAGDSGSYRRVIDIWDHFYTGIKYLQSPPSSEQLVMYASGRDLPADAFDRKAEIDKRYAVIKQRLDATARTPIALESTPHPSAYDFANGTFAWPRVDQDVGSYKYTVKQNEQPVLAVAYDLTTSQSLQSYKPKNLDDAKAIERARAGNKLRMVTYANISGAVLQEKRIVVKGVVAAVEWLDESNKVLARIESK